MDGNSSVPGKSPSTEETFEHLYPSLLQCFTVILLGYCVGRLGYISPTSSKGIGVFVSLVSLPALLFKSMVELDYSQVNWRFLSSILIAKSTVFFSVVLFTLILVRPTNFGKAGIYGIFCSQSNDMALGYPLGKSLWPTTSRGGGGVHLGILGRGVPPGSPNPDPISDQNISFSTPVFRPGL